MIVVSNTSTLILLAKIDMLGIWREQVANIIIPPDVMHEVQQKREEYDARLIAKYVQEGKITIEKPALERVRAAIHSFRLDVGEAAAYALFNPKKHHALMTDDGELIKLCKLEGIPYIGALAIVVWVWERQKINTDTARDTIEKLRTIGRYRQDIITHFLSKLDVEESK